MRLALDVDGVICNFLAGFFKEAGIPYDAYKKVDKFHFLEEWGLMDVWERVKGRDSFWAALPPLDKYVPSCCVAYVSDRPCFVEVTKRWLDKNGFPDMPTYHTSKKEEVLRYLHLDGLVDDKAETFLRMCQEFPASFLVSRPWNRNVVTPNRIYRLEELDWRVSHL